MIKNKVKVDDIVMDFIMKIESECDEFPLYVTIRDTSMYNAKKRCHSWFWKNHHTRKFKLSCVFVIGGKRDIDEISTVIDLLKTNTIIDLSAVC